MSWKQWQPSLNIEKKDFENNDTWPSLNIKKTRQNAIPRIEKNKVNAILNFFIIEIKKSMLNYSIASIYFKKEGKQDL